MTVKFLPSGDSAIVVEFGDRIDRALSDRVLKLSGRVRGARLKGVVETVPTFRSLMVHYDPLATSADKLQGAIEGLIDGAATAAGPRRLWRVPACYEGEFAPDLEEVAARTGLTASEVVTLHSGQRYHVYMLGFLPGYPYLGDLPAQLSLPRRADPRLRVPAGSVAIATRLTAIYSLASPGGWHLIGATPISLFDASRPSPALFAPGDAVEFEPIGRGAYAELADSVRRGEHRLAPRDLAP